MGWERHLYRTIDDLHGLVEAAVKLSSVVEIRVKAGVVEVRHRDGMPPAPLQEIRLPSDDLLDRVRAGGVDWKVLHHGNVRTALLEGIAIMRREGVHATHLATGDMARLLKALKMYDSSEDPGMTRWLGGLELVEHRDLEQDVYLLCGGGRVHGPIAEISTIVRLEQEEA